MLKWMTDFTYKIENKAIEIGLIYKLACNYYRDVIKKEAVLANITQEDVILCIGGGVCPFSAILFHQITGAKVTVIDNNKDCIPKAQKAIERLALTDKVKVICEEGCSSNINFADYTVVHLALQVSPMEKVFSYVKDKIAPGTKLLLRRPKKQLDNIYCHLEKTSLTKGPYTTHKSRNIGSTILYIKQKERQTKVSA